MARPTTAPQMPCLIRVVVREDAPDDDGAVIHDRCGNHNDAIFRDWITDTQWWAMRNGKTVSMYPAT